MNETAAKIATREMPDKEESQPGSRSTAPWQSLYKHHFKQRLVSIISWFPFLAKKVKLGMYCKKYLKQKAIIQMQHFCIIFKVHKFL